MKYAILSDIHANRDALERVLKDAAQLGAERIVCLGDIVGYGPLPAETLARVRETCSVIVAGNHDDAVSGRVDAADFIDLAGDAVSRHREALDPEALNWLKSLPHQATLEGALLVHGDAVDPAKFYYVEDTADATANFNATDAQLIFVGHTHVPSLFLVGHSGTVYATDPQDFVLEDGKRYIVNPGSVGYPRETNGQCHSSYVLYDSVEKSITYRYLPFAVSSVMQRGQSPRKLKKSVLALILLVVAALAASTAFLLKKEKRIIKTETETVVETVEVDKAAARIVATRTLAIPAGTRAVRANLVLAKDSDPVDLTLIFRNEKGNETGRTTDTVKQKSTKKMSVPKGTLSVDFTVSRQADDASVTLESFEPAPDRRTDA